MTKKDTDTISENDNHKKSKLFSKLQGLVVFFLIFECVRDIVAVVHAKNNLFESSGDAVEAIFHLMSALILLPHRFYHLFTSEFHTTFNVLAVIGSIGLLVNFFFMPKYLAIIFILIAIILFFTQEKWKVSTFIFIALMAFEVLIGILFLYALFFVRH